jgi:hypothetical protein
MLKRTLSIAALWLAAMTAARRPRLHDPNSEP